MTVTEPFKRNFSPALTLEYVGFVRPAGAAPRSNIGNAAGQSLSMSTDDAEAAEDVEDAAIERVTAMTKGVQLHRSRRRQDIWTPLFIPHSLKNQFTITKP